MSELRNRPCRISPRSLRLLSHRPSVSTASLPISHIPVIDARPSIPPPLGREGGCACRDRGVYREHRERSSFRRSFVASFLKTPPHQATSPARPPPRRPLPLFRSEPTKRSPKIRAQTAEIPKDPSTLRRTADGGWGWRTGASPAGRLRWRGWQGAAGTRGVLRSFRSAERAAAAHSSPYPIRATVGCGG